MDGKAAIAVRKKLGAMRGIVRVWEGMKSPDAQSVLDLLHDLMNQVMAGYPRSGRMYTELRALQRYLASADGYGSPEEIKPHLFERIGAVAAAFDHIHGALLTPMAANATLNGVANDPAEGPVSGSGTC